MAGQVSPEFYWSEAERLLQLAATTIDRVTRVELLEMAARYWRMAADLQAQHAVAANNNTDPESESA